MEHPYTEVDCFASSQSVEAARLQVDKDIRALEESICRLKQRRNSIALVFRLPPELLSHIFKFCTLPDPESYTGRAINRNDIGWIKISHICSHWRAVALECPGLWSDILFQSPKWTAEMLRRSKNAALRIIVDSGSAYLTPKLVEAVQATMNHLPRFRELQLTLNREQTEKLMSRCGEYPAPLLQSLHLSVSPVYGRYDYANAASMVYTLPQNVFNGGQTPKLRHIQLHNCAIAWDSPILSGLTHLVLQSIPIGKRPTTQQVLHVLAKMPNLAHLELSNVFPNENITTTTTTTTASVVAPGDDSIASVALPHLKDLIILSDLDHITRFLNSLKYPSGLTTSITIGPVIGTTRLTTLGALLPHIRLLTFGIPAFRALAIHVYSGSGLSFTGWHEPNGHTQPPKAPVFQFNFMGAVSATVDEICAHLPLANLRYVAFESPLISVKTCKRLFGRLKNLQTIKITSANPTKVVKCFAREVPVAGTPSVPAVVAPPVVETVIPERRRSRRESTIASSSAPHPARKGKPPPQAAPPLYFAALTNLTLQNAEFSEELVDDFALPFQAFCDVLMKRCDHGVPIRDLYLLDCSRIEDGDVGKLREIAVEVHWDGYVQGYTDSEEEEEDPDSDFYGDGYHDYDSFY